MLISQLPTRYAVAALGLMGMAVIYGLRVNISVAIVAMVNHSALVPIKSAEIIDQAEESAGITMVNSTGDECGFTRESGVLHKEDGPFLFTAHQQGLILSSYYWGYIISMIPGGRISELYSAKWVMFFAVVINMASTLLTPLAAVYAGYAGVIVCQFLKGIGGGVTFPCTHCLLSHWSPKEERSKLSSLTYTGTCLGTVISQYMSGALSSHFGWASVFYVSGCLAVPWVISWACFVTDYPGQHRYIGKAERDMLEANLQTSATSEKPKLPWRDILKSRPFWALFISHACSNWGYYVLLIELPIYLRTILLFGIKENGILTAISFLAMAISTVFCGYVVDHYIKKGSISIGNARKLSTGIASIGPALCMALITFVGCERYLGAGLLCIAVACHGAMFSGFVINHMDIAPRYAGTLMAFTNVPGTVSGIIVPVFVGSITNNNNTVEAWRIIFFVTVGLYFIEFTVFSLWGSGEEQYWNKGPKNVSSDTMQTDLQLDITDNGSPESADGSNAKRF